MVGYGPQGCHGPELDEDFPTFGEVGEDTLVGGFGDSVVRPDCVGAGEDGFEHERSGAVA